MSHKQVRLTQVKSAIGRLDSHKACLKGLGVRRMNVPVNVVVTPENMGMIGKVSYLLRIEDI
jgi:large subunit ribosomal protein L30